MNRLPLAALVLALLAGCYSRPKLAPRATPSVARMHVAMQVDESAFGNFFGGVTDEIGARLKSQIEGDVLQKRYALIVQRAEDADVHLAGRLFATVRHAHFEWKITDARGVVILAGKDRVNNFQDDEERFADSVLKPLSTVDLDPHAKQSTAVVQRTQRRMPPATPAPPPALAKPSLPPPPSSSTRNDNAWAIVIGVERYREKLPVATHAEADAKAFAEYAQKTLGVPEAHVRVLLGQRAGKSDIESMLQEWLPRNARQPGGKVYVFFSGHGAPEPNSGDAYLVPWDADPAYIKTRGVKVSTIYAQLEALKGQQAYVFLDACFSGSGDRSVIAAGTRPLVPVNAPTAQRIVALTASAARETTGAARDASHGLFTRHLLSGLGGAADANRDGKVTLAELAGHVKARVSKDARLDNREQNPSLIVSEDLDPATHALVKGLR